jgi:demethylmenaquinone methyltransferase/2-methoxy-6-polyprenyl-1,4-benzoquinol methylase
MSEDKKKTHFGFRDVDRDEKKGLVNQVFDSVAGKYDLMNDLMSLGTHRLWKRYMLSELGLKPGQKIIDVAGGTADIAILMAGEAAADGKGGEVTVFDINLDMMRLGRDKAVDSGFVKEIRFVQGDAEAISFVDNSFDVATIGFGIRNVTDIPKALSEMARVVRPGGKVACLEFSKPVNRAFGKLYDAYSFGVIPAIGDAVTGDRGSYVYLAESIRRFPPQEEFKRMMEEVGLYRVRYHNIFGGIAALHMGYKV